MARGTGLTVTPSALFGPGDPGPVDEWLPRARAFRALLVCDHASSRVPGPLRQLGLTDDELGRHIAVDLGAAELTKRLASLLQVPAVLSGYSRLVVDCNRHLDDPSAFPARSDGVTIPGNAALDAAACSGRAHAFYWPYHRAIARTLDGLGNLPALIAIHSFTPHFEGAARPWHVGVLWDRDPHLARVLLGALRADGRWCVGDNEPYSGSHPAGFTMDEHAERRGLPHVSIEVRQDLLATPEGVACWASLLASALRPILAARLGTSVPPGFQASDQDS